MKNDSKKIFTDMKKGIDEVGGLFFQYRPCSRNKYTIYDIENIRHGVLYARTPLEMNDPFDSLVGYSPEKIYENCIEIVVNSISMPDEFRAGIITILKSRQLGQFSVMLQTLTDIRKYILQRRLFMRKCAMNINLFITQNQKELFLKCPSNIKTILSKDSFLALAIVACNIPSDVITENLIERTIGLSQSMEQIHTTAIMIRDNEFHQRYQKMLSEIAVTCLSASGWNNQLMWAHYANAYSGICIEYDLSSINGSEGLIYPVKYTDTRPLIELSDLGLNHFDIEQKTFSHDEIDLNKVFSLLLAKNSCWSYEKEWRIINPSKAYTPVFVHVPRIISVTFGTKIDPICKRILIDICKEKGISCFNLVPSKEDYSLSREQINMSSLTNTIEEDIEFISYIHDHLFQASHNIETMTASLDNSLDEETIIAFLNQMIDIFTDAYFFKVTLNRIYMHYEKEALRCEDLLDLAGSISSMETFIATWEASSKQFEKGLNTTKVSEMISLSKYSQINQCLTELREILTTIKSQDWHPMLVQYTLSKSP